MPGLTALDLARIQFAFTMSFRILFPAVTIGLASYLAVLELSWLRTRRRVYVDLYHFWLKIFAVMFGMDEHALASTIKRGATAEMDGELPDQVSGKPIT